MRRMTSITATVAGPVASALSEARSERLAALESLRVANGLSRPIYVTAPPGDLERLFIVEQTGKIKILELDSGTVLEDVRVVGDA